MVSHQPPPRKSGFIWISPLRRRQAVSCIAPNLPPATHELTLIFRDESAIQTTSIPVGASTPRERSMSWAVTFLFFDGGWVGDSVVWTGIGRWGLLGRDPRGLAAVHVLAADRAVILRRDWGGGREKRRVS